MEFPFSQGSCTRAVPSKGKAQREHLQRRRQGRQTLHTELEHSSTTAAVPFPAQHPALAWNSRPRAALPSALPSGAFSHGKDGSALQLLPFPVSCSIELPGCTAHSQRIVNSQRIKNGRNLPSSGRGALQAGCLLLQSMLDASQGLSPELRMSRGCHGMQAHFAQHREFQLRAVIIPKQTKGGKFVEGEVT